MHPPHPTSEPRFDNLSFVKEMKDNGREYRNQAIELISICQNFVQAQNQSRSSYDELRRYYSQIMPLLCPDQLFRKCATGRRRCAVFCHGSGKEDNEGCGREIQKGNGCVE